jgi:AraC-like DNA-binding protein
MGHALSPDLPLPRYAEFLPSPELAPWVECYWSIRASDAPAFSNRVLPDGCADLIVGIAGDPTPMVVGAMRTAAVIPTAGTVDLFGIRFHPGAALALLDAPLGELTDRRIRLEAIWGSAAEELAAALEPAAPAARAARAEGLLRRRLAAAWVGRRRGDEAMVTEAVKLLRRARGGVGVGQVAAALGIGQRRLERAFDRSVGLSPKALARVLRFRRALRDLGRLHDPRSAPGWASLALGAGYADQSHFIREFKALAGLTPSRYLAERRGVGFVQYAGDGSV